MHQQHTAFAVSPRCQLLEGSRRGSYEWLSRPPRPPADAEPEGQDKRPRYVAQGRGPYGTRRSKHLLAQAGLRCTTQRKVQAPHRAEQAQTLAPTQRNRELTVHVPDPIYVGDMPDLPTGEGWLSLAVVLELGSRAVVGGAMANQMRAALVTQALSMALYQRQPAAGVSRPTDRGSPYGADSYRQLLPPHAIQPSMRRKGNGWANAVAESFFHPLKTA
jgi:putative transposase